MPRVLEETSRFTRDKKRIKGSGRHDWEKMRAVVQELMHDRPWTRGIAITTAALHGPKRACLQSGGHQLPVTAALNASSPPGQVLA